MATQQLLMRVNDLKERAATPEGRRILAGRLEETIRRSKVGGTVLDKLRLMYDYYRDPAEPIKPKLLIGAGLLYFVSPTDAIADFLPVIGFTDDLAVIAIVWKQVYDVLRHYEKRRQRRLIVKEA